MKSQLLVEIRNRAELASLEGLLHYILAWLVWYEREKVNDRLGAGEFMAFDARFYLAALPNYVHQRCETEEGNVPVLQLHLADGTQLDLCHIAALADSWFTVAYFRNPDEGEDTDVAFLPYGFVQWITLAFHPPHVRRIGFDVARSREAALASVPVVAGLPVPPATLSQQAATGDAAGQGGATATP